MDERLTSESETPVRKIRHPDRVTLGPEALNRLDTWITQITTCHRGVRLTRNNLVEWLIVSRPMEMPRADETALAERFYDEERFLREVVREMRVRKSRGESVELSELLARTPQPKGPRQPKRPKQRTKAPTTDSNITTASP